MQYFVYIGKDSKTINLFSKLSIGVFYAASNCNQAIKVLDKIREKYDTALFFEQINLSQDIANIHYMRKKYPGLYMVLVIDSLSTEEAPKSLKAGIKHNIKYRKYKIKNCNSVCPCEFRYKKCVCNNITRYSKHTEYVL